MLLHCCGACLDSRGESRRLVRYLNSGHPLLERPKPQLHLRGKGAEAEKLWRSLQRRHAEHPQATNVARTENLMNNNIFYIIGVIVVVVVVLKLIGLW